MDRNPQIGEDYWERYLDIVGCRPVSEWLGLHIWLPRWGALGWCSSEFSSGSLSHSGCYTPTTRSMSTSLRSLPQQNKNQKFTWINLKCLAESKELAFDIHYAFFPLVRTEREKTECFLLQWLFMYDCYGSGDNGKIHLTHHSSRVCGWETHCGFGLLMTLLFLHDVRSNVLLGQLEWETRRSQSSEFYLLNPGFLSFCPSFRSFFLLLC